MPCQRACPSKTSRTGADSTCVELQPCTFSITALSSLIFSRFATHLQQMSHCPFVRVDTGDFRRRCFNRPMNLDEITVSEIERNRSLKIRQVLAECVGQPG